MTTTSHPTRTPYLIPAHEGERIWIVGDTMWTKASAATTSGSQSVLEFEAVPGGGPPPHTHSSVLASEIVALIPARNGSG